MRTIVGHTYTNNLLPFGSIEFISSLYVTELIRLLICLFIHSYKQQQKKLAKSTIEVPIPNAHKTIMISFLAMIANMMKINEWKSSRKKIFIYSYYKLKYECHITRLFHIQFYVWWSRENIEHKKLQWIDHCTIMVMMTIIHFLMMIRQCKVNECACVRLVVHMWTWKKNLTESITINKYDKWLVAFDLWPGHHRWDAIVSNGRNELFQSWIIEKSILLPSSLT